jgi:hypothetical protein
MVGDSIRNVFLQHQEPYLFLRSCFDQVNGRGGHPAGINTHCVVKINNPFDIVRYRNVSSRVLNMLFGEGF